MKAQWWMWGVLCVPVLAGAAPPVAAVYECLIEPSQVVELRTTVEGLIDKVNVRRGDSVRRGQVLAELQSRAEKLAVASAKFRAGMEGQIDTSQSRIAYATKKLARAEELHRQNMVSAQSRDDADAELRLANAELKAAMENRDLARIEQQRAEEQLAMRTLVSPFDGVVIDRLLNPGDLAESGSGRKAVLKLAQIDPLRVDIILPGALFGKIRAGARVVVLPQGDAVRHSATVSMVDKVVDAASGTLVARVDLPNRDGKIPSGVRCRAEFDAGLLGLGAVDAR
jgi:RND family efflux transporter MFP subunit